MSFLDTSESLWQALVNVISDEGLSLYDAERLGGGGLRVVIAGKEDPSDGQQSMSVTSGDCSKVCKRLLYFFSVEGESFGLAQDLHLEVSSPGVNRSLRLAGHFVSAVGQRVKVVPLDGSLAGPSRDPFVGCLQSFDDGCLELSDERTGENVSIELKQVKKSNVEFKF